MGIYGQKNYQTDKQVSPSLPSLPKWDNAAPAGCGTNGSFYSTSWGGVGVDHLCFSEHKLRNLQNLCKSDSRTKQWSPQPLSPWRLRWAEVFYSVKVSTNVHESLDNIQRKFMAFYSPCWKRLLNTSTWNRPSVVHNSACKTIIQFYVACGITILFSHFQWGKGPNLIA